MAQLASYTQMQAALQAGQQVGMETIHQAIRDLQRAAETESQRQDTVVSLGTEINRMKERIENNDREIKQRLEANDATLKQAVDTEVTRIREAGQGLEMKVTVAEQQLQNMETKHASLLQEAQQARQDIQTTQRDTQQAMATMQQSMNGALEGQSQELAAIRQFQDSLGGPIANWANGVNTQLKAVNDAVIALQTAVTVRDRSIEELQEAVSRGSQGQEGLKRQMKGILESKAWSGLKTLDPEKMNFREWMMKLKNSFYQARPGQITVTMWERVDERGREHATNRGKGW